MKKKKSLKKLISDAAEIPQPRTFKPHTWIRCIRTSMWSSKIEMNKDYLFMGWIVNDHGAENAVLMDDRGVFIATIIEENFEVI